MYRGHRGRSVAQQQREVRASGTWRFLKRPMPRANFENHGLSMELRDAVALAARQMRLDELPVDWECAERKLADALTASV